MKRLSIVTKILSHIFSNPKSLTLYPKEYKVTGTQNSECYGEFSIEPFYIQKVTDDFLAIGVKNFLDPTAKSANITIERVYECPKYSVSCLVHDRDLTLILAEEEDGEESPDYPIGGMVEEYDIERDKELCD